ncbi:hypothetical protein AAC387_Pa04g1755 [Persea americana]
MQNPRSLDTSGETKRCSDGEQCFAMEFERDVDHISAATKQEQSFTMETSYFSVDKVITTRDRYNQRIRLLNNEDKTTRYQKKKIM